MLVIKGCVLCYICFQMQYTLKWLAITNLYSHVIHIINICLICLHTVCGSPYVNRISTLDSLEPKIRKVAAALKNRFIQKVSLIYILKQRLVFLWTNYVTYYSLNLFTKRRIREHIWKMLKLWWIRSKKINEHRVLIHLVVDIRQLALLTCKTK